MSTRRRRGRAWQPGEAGLTLIEILITLALAGILSAGLFFMASGQQRTYNNQLNALNVQQNLWGAMGFIKRHIEQAGYGFGGCAKPPGQTHNTVGEAPVYAGGVTGDVVVRGLWVHNGCNLTGTDPAPPNLNCRYNDPTTGGEDNTRVDSLSVAKVPLAASNVLGRTRVTNVMSASGIGVVLRSPTGFLARETGTGPTDGLHHVIFWAVGTPTACFVRQLTNYGPVKNGDGNWEFQHQAPSGAYVPASINVAVQPGTAVYPATMAISTGEYIPEQRHIAIQTNRNPPRLITWTGHDDPTTALGSPLNEDLIEVVANGIEDMQIAWACDANGDNVLQEGTDAASRQNDEWAYNIAGDTLPACGSHPVQLVRVTLIARTQQAVQGAESFRPAAEDRPAGTVAEDNALSDSMGTGNRGSFPRRRLTLTIRPRNLQ